jgi:hypothetical protein
MSKEPTAQELLSQVQAEREVMDQRFDELKEKLEKFGPHGYSAGSEVTISGQLFADFLNTVAHIKGTLEQMTQATNYLMDYTAGMTIRLMETHVSHIETNQAVSAEQLDKEDAQKRIQEVDK